MNNEEYLKFYDDREKKIGAPKFCTQCRAKLTQTANFCSACGIQVMKPTKYEDLSVDHLKAINSRQMVGYKAQGSKRHVPIIYGIVCLIAAFFIYIKFSGWWTYIAGGILFMLGWVSLKTGLFASKKEIKELTELGPISEETKKKFQDRL